MSNEFTLMEYVRKNELGVGERDSAGQRMVADHLRKHGYIRRRVRRAENGGKAELVWSKNDRKAELAALAEKLSKLEGGP